MKILNEVVRSRIKLFDFMKWITFNETIYLTNSLRHSHFDRFNITNSNKFVKVLKF